jgi:hypothetical protein
MLKQRVNVLESSLDKIHEVNRQCQEANIDENDYTVYSIEDLTYDLSLVKKALAKKEAFIENQASIYSRDGQEIHPNGMYLIFRLYRAI